MSENSEQQAHSEDLFNTEDLMSDAQIGNSEEPSELMNTDENHEEMSATDENTEITEESQLNDEEQLHETEPENNDGVDDEEEVQGKENVQVAKKVIQNRLTELPLAKIKHIIKLDPEVKLVSNEAVFAITKCTELFIKSLGKESFGFAAQNKKKTITKNHVDSALGMLPIEL